VLESRLREVCSYSYKIDVAYVCLCDVLLVSNCAVFYTHK